MKTNEYGEIYNCLENYREIALDLFNEKAVVIKWIDEEGSPFTILLAYNVKGYEGNYLHRGIKKSDLFINILPYRAYAFNIDKKIDFDYMLGKLHLGDIKLARKINELLNGIRVNLKGIRGK